jgi:hypothetical protein
MFAITIFQFRKNQNRFTGKKYRTWRRKILEEKVVFFEKAKNEKI